MITNPTVKIYLVLLALASCLSVKGQDNMVNRLDLSGDLESWYDSIAGIQNSILVEGSLADFTRKATQSHPYMFEYRWQTGEVTYRNQHFKGVPLLYNIERDELIILREGISSYENFVKLNKDLVTDFKLNNTRFVKLDKDRAPGKPGFYQELHAGDQLSFYAKRVKIFDRNGDDNFQYVQSNEYYIKYQNEFYVIRNVGTLTRLFKENRKQINKFASIERIRKLNSLGIDTCCTVKYGW